MHLLKGQPRVLPGEAEPVDLGQTPGDIVILTAADTEIAGLAAARRALGEPFPAVRLANWMALAHPYSVDRYGETVLARAKLVVLRLLGGASYWRYGLDEAVRIARAGGGGLAVLPGDATWDAALAANGTFAEDAAKRLWAYLVEGGSENLANALRFCAYLIGEGEEPEGARPLPSAGVYSPAGGSAPSPTCGERVAFGVSRRLGEGGSGAGEITPPRPQPASRATPSPQGGWGSAAAIVFYRALVQAGQTEPVDALAAALAARGLRPLLFYVSSLKAAEDASFLARELAAAKPALVLNATAFALSEPGGKFAGTVLDGHQRPVLQVTFAGVSEEVWAGSSRGLSPTDLTMNVVLPEIDGRVITRAISFKEAGAFDPLTECRPVRYRPRADRVAFVADLAARWARLSVKSNGEKSVAIVLSNYPNRDGRIANGVGLDAPASTANLLQALREAGYATDGAPASGAALMDLLLAGPTNARRGTSVPPPPFGEGVAAPQERLGAGGVSQCSTIGPPTQPSANPKATLPPQGGEGLALVEYRRFFSRLPESVQRRIEERWSQPKDDPFVEDGAFVLPVHRFGNVVIGVQPARGYNLDPKASYHDPDLVPPHSYFAFYIWLREKFRADAVVHMGKHGNLEWLPGKALALSEECFPEAALGPVPVVYPFIVNDVGSPGTELEFAL